MMRTTDQILEAAKSVRAVPASLSTEKKREVLFGMADSLCRNTARILDANKEDIAAARGKVSDVMIDRLSLNESRIADMADGMREVAQLPDPVGRILDSTVRPNGLLIEKTAVPMGVVAIIFESRPNVTSDAAALSFMSGNVCILRGGKEAYRSCKAIVDALRDGIAEKGLPRDILCQIDDTSRESANRLMTAVGYVDLLIPRGGAGLIRACVENARVPCIQTGTGICHVYVDRDADLDMALDIIENAKTSRPSVCNAEEVCLIDREIAARFLPMLYKRLVTDREQPVELRTDTFARQFIGGTPASDTDFDTEFLDYILAVAVVDGVDSAIEHIALHSTGHSESIVTSNTDTAREFTRRVDSAAVYVNASTRFTDGGQFGLGCEMGISTQRLHARGPMGLSELCTYKYVVTGNGQVR